MSIFWRYMGSFSTNGLIRKIEFVNKLDCNPPIYKWKVIMKNDEIYDMDDKILKTNTYTNNLSIEDKKALSDAFDNNKKLTNKAIMDIYSKIF